MITNSAQRSKNQAMALVQKPLSDDERMTILAAIGDTAESSKEFTTDDLKVSIPNGVNPKVLGPLMRQAASYGWIEKTDRTRNSTNATCNARPKAVWRSLIAQL